LEYIKDAPGEIITPVRSALSGTIVLNPPTVEQPIECIREGEETLMRFLNRFRKPRQTAHTIGV
jgi:hypothetical protein